MGNAKVIFGNETLIDLTGDTVSANNLLSGATAHNRSGDQVAGTVYGVPSGGTTGQYLNKHSNTDGDTEWTTLDDMTGATASTPGTHGLVPAPAAGDNTKFLRGDGTWAEAGGGGGGFVLADWLTAGGLNPMSYADLAAVLADEKAVRKLMTIHSAVDYLTQFGAAETNIATILSSNVCAKWITLRDYALDTLMFYFENTMKSLGKYEYGEWAKLSTSPETWAPKGNVPIMTSNTAPYGTASAYQVFDGNASTTASGTDFSYQFVNPICPKDFICKNASGQDITGGTMQASNDGSTWAAPVDGEYYLNLRVHFAASTTVATVQFYGRELKVSVPVMTSNTAPYGVAFSSTVYQTRGPWKAFNGLTASDSDTYASSDSVGCYVGYKFITATVVKQVTLIGGSSGNYYATKLKIQASNDNNTWDDLTSTLNYTTAGSLAVYDINNDTAYLYYRMYVLEVSNVGSGITVRELQFYGLNYSEYDWDADNPRHYLYDHGVEPNGALERMTSENGWSQSGRTFAQNSQKLPYGLYIAPTTSGIVDGFGVSNSIDLSAYNLMRYIADANGSSRTDSCLFFSICSAKTNFESTSRIANDSFYGKPSGSLDISAINQNAFPCTYSINYYLRTGYVYEMWLE